MKKNLLLALTLLLSITSGFSQDKLWKKVTDEKLNLHEKMERASNPAKYDLYSLDFNALKSQLQSAPLDSEGRTSNVVVTFPIANGKTMNYSIYEAPIMEKELANKFPDIKSYIGKGIEDPTATIRFSTTLFGLHVMAISGDAGTFYIDTYTKDLNNYIVYNRKDLIGSRSFSCQVEDDHEKVAEQEVNALRATDGKFRQYRLAMACTIEYAAYHVNAAGLASGTLAQKKAAVLSAMTVTMTRVNGIYEKDMSLRMNLVANNDLIIFITSDSFSNTNANNLINESQSVIDGAIGSANYDIGHTVSTGGGGLAGLGVVCTAGQKGRGITGSPAPVGDAYDVDYVAHEVGHQFGGPHTFSGVGGNCAGNGSAADAVEPASGSTIMAYAGICGPDVQPNSDPYFHAVSIAKMNAYMIGSGNCAPQANNSNNPPVITALSNYTIPYGTAFVLTGNATDADGSASLTYCWEQTNAASGVEGPTTTQTTGPSYRSFNPTSSPQRYFPRLADVLAGTLTPTWEVTPNVARTMNFALTVRDNQTPTGGQTARANMTVTTANVGPFMISSPSVDNTSWAPASNQTVTWNVAGTTANGINTANVNILFSSDNGATFTALVSNTPNDGTQSITLPNVTAPFCRIKIEAVGNVFYAMSKNISLGYTVTNSCTTYNATISANTIAAQTPLAWQAFGTVAVPDSVTITDFNATVNITHPRINDLYIGIVKPGSSVVDLIVFQQSCGTTFANMNTTFDDEGVTLACAGVNAGNAYKPLNSLSTFDGLNSAGTWRLAIADVAAANNGTLNSYSFTICSQTVTLSSETFGLQNFSIYPNPNNGNFTVQFDSQSSNDIKVGVHDMRGRLVFEKDYQNTGTFNQNLQLNNVQSGIYMVTVQDGDRKETKKIVIN
jgi:subtilisin-like proprotein convertase family protein